MKKRRHKADARRALESAAQRWARGNTLPLVLTLEARLKDPTLSDEARHKITVACRQARKKFNLEAA